MISFESDYVSGAHPEVLKRLVETNFESLPGYGDDKYTVSAREKIKTVTGKPEADVFFVSGGTQVNQLVISTLLDDGDGVVAVKSGHINVHESGAIEFTGHKVLAIDGKDGKIVPEKLSEYLESDYDDHMVRPGMLYISHPTEYGTIYSKKELCEIYGICKKHSIPLFIDGARLGYGLSCSKSDMDIKEIASMCDVFTIGGTKVGALCGEAAVFSGIRAPERFIAKIKQRGGLMAKGRVLGVQFDALFTDGLYFRISEHVAGMADMLRNGLIKLGVEFFVDSPTNQLFPVFDDSVIEKISGKVKYSFWEKAGHGRSIVRFATGWATEKEDIEELLSMLNEIILKND